MAKIPTVSRQQQPSGQLGAGFIDPSAARTGGELVGRALQRLGAGVGDLGESLDRIDDRRANTELKQRQAETSLRLGKARADAANAASGEESQQIMATAIEFERTNKLENR